MLCDCFLYLLKNGSDVPPRWFLTERTTGPRLLCSKECGRFLCAVFCLPCQMASTMNHAGKSRSESAALGVAACALCVAALLHTMTWHTDAHTCKGAANGCMVQFNHANALLVAGTSTTAPGTLAALGVSAGLVALGSAAFVARAINDVHTARGGARSTIKFAVATCFWPTCTSYQLNRALDSEWKDWI